MIAMADVRYVPFPADIPANVNYILVKYVKKNALQRHSRGLTVTVAESDEPNLREAHTTSVMASHKRWQTKNTSTRCSSVSRRGAERFRVADQRGEFPVK